VRDNEDLVGAKFTRRRTFVKYLDAVNFSGGNASADPNVFFADEIWYIDRKASENGIFIEFELASAMDLTNVKLPKRQVTQNICAWQYRSAECGYTGGPVATFMDVITTDSAQDVCGHRVSSCKLRFGNNASLPYGGFEGSSN
jgi:lambda family phage minor tail protein L